MIIRRLKLQNIRSYREASIELPLGKTLFEGDIGSGKSTLLMAIEFALFGLGSETGASLLRAGEQEGKVGVVFEVDGKEYDVVRTLVRKGERVQQTEGVLGSPEGVAHLSPAELKEKMLEVLEFNEPSDPKSQSVIYRYAVYTPQEEMKSIIFMRPELRLQTLRRAFRIEDYKTAKENATELSRALRSRAREFDAMAADVRSVGERLAGERAALEGRRRDLETLRTAEGEREALLQSLEREREKLRADEQRLRVALSEASLLEKFLRSSEREIGSLSGEVEVLEKRVGKARTQMEEKGQVGSPVTRTQDELRKEVEQLESHLEELRRLEMKSEAKLEDYRTILETGSCPTCDREANPDEFVEKVRVRGREKEEMTERVESHRVALERARSLLETRRLYESARESLEEYEDDLGRKKGRLEEALARHQESKKRLEESRDGVGELKGLSARIEELDLKIKGAERELRSVRNDSERARADIDNLGERVKEHEEEQRKKEEVRGRAEAIKEHQIWVDDYFVPTLDAIERHVLTNINQDFNSNFQSWFAGLVEDPSKEARVDENFTPIVEQDGYEQEVYYLSGGEKTSLALAYRLALNNIVQRVSTGMSTNLVIFDEPTDGFSKEQLGKVREILDELQSPQVIIVSHEKELESFADQIFRVVKSDGESRILVSGY